MITWINYKYEIVINSLNNYFHKTSWAPKLVLTFLVLSIFISIPLTTLNGTISLIYTIIFTGLGILSLLILTFIFKLIRFFLSNISKSLLPILFVSFSLLFAFLCGVIGASPETAFIFSLAIIITETMLGLSLGVLIKKKFKSIIALVLAIITLSLNIFSISFLKGSGEADSTLNNYISSLRYTNLEIQAENPSDKGKYKVKTLYYGSGIDKNRSEFGKNVEIKTNSVDLSPFLQNYNGIYAKIRNFYWGFNVKDMPINGRVWYPVGQGKFPLVLIVHGNHLMEDYSDTGYEYLGKLLASRGFITVSVDENFLNSDYIGNLGNNDDGRAYLLLKHLDAWAGFNSSANNPFYGKVDLQNIALVGHSRGGEAVSIAAFFNKLTRYPDDGNIAFNFNYNIKSVIAIAPSYGQYKACDKYTKIKNVNYLLIQGANDSDVSTFMGRSQYNNVYFDKDTDYFKSLIYIYKANHGQFNTVWGDKDIPAVLGGYLLNRKTLLTASDQEQIVKVYISAFLDTTLKNKENLKPIFKNYEYANKWLPKTAYINDFQDSKFNTICNFEEDSDLTTASLQGVTLSGKNVSWTEKSQGFRKYSAGFPDNSVLNLKWSGTHNSYYKINLSENADKLLELKDSSNLTMSVASIDYDSYKKVDFKAPYFTIKATDIKGNSSKVSLKSYGILHPAIGVRLSKLDFFSKDRYGQAFEPVLQVFNIPFRDFKSNNPNFDIEKINSIEFLFNKTNAGNLIIDNIGIE